jgi:hypothetical protein
VGAVVLEGEQEYQYGAGYRNDGICEGKKNLDKQIFF